MSYIVMILIYALLFTVIGGLIYNVVFNKHKVSLFFASLIVFVIAAFVGFMFDIIVTSKAEYEYTQVYSRDLKGINDPNNVDSFVLGLGDDDINYYYMIKDGEDNWKMSAMAADKVTIVQISNDSTPRIVKEVDRIIDEEVREKSFTFIPSYKYTMFLPENYVTAKYPITGVTTTTE